MRENWSIRSVLLTALIVLFLAYVFARIQNPNQTIETIKNKEQISSSELRQSAVLDPKRIEAGRKIYKQQSCSLCHSIAGQGNPRSVLDGVATKRTVRELRNFITGADTLQGVLPESVRKMKQRYRELSDDELNALIIYMQSLKKR